MIENQTAYKASRWLRENMSKYDLLGLGKKENHGPRFSRKSLSHYQEGFDIVFGE